MNSRDQIQKLIELKKIERSKSWYQKLIEKSPMSFPLRTEFSKGIGLLFDIHFDPDEGRIVFGINPGFFYFFLTAQDVPYEFFKKFLPKHYFTAHWENPPRETWILKDRQIRISVHDWTIHWSIWTQDNMIWDSNLPRWRNHYFSIKRFLFGKFCCDRKTVEDWSYTIIPMPEGCYLAKVKKELFKRYRWRTRFWKHREFAYEIKIPGGIPYSGKGENSWDQGQDGLFGTHIPVESEYDSDCDAIGRVVASVLNTRKKRYDRIDFGLGKHILNENYKPPKFIDNETNEQPKSNR